MGRLNPAPWLVLAFLAGWLAGGGRLAAAAPDAARPTSSKAKKQRPARLEISGYGFFGNRELKHMLRTFELAGKKPEFFGASFVEDSALLLASRVKRDGYLEPTILISVHLAGGGQIDVSADALLENPLPRPLQATSVRFKIEKGILYYLKSLTFGGLQTVKEKQARSYFMETETLFHTKRSRIFTSERLRQGLSSLSEVLDQQGYREAKVDAAQVHRNNKTGAVAVEVQVRQGAKFVVQSVHEQFFYQGIPKPEEERTLYPNKPYSRMWSQDFTLSVKTNLYHQGYPDTTVRLKTLSQKATNQQVQVELDASVEAGNQVRIGSVEFEGARRTSRWLMARAVRIKRGDLLDPIRVEAGRARLARLGIFDLVDLNYKPVDPHTREVIYDLKEGKTLTVSLLFGWGSYELLRGGAEASLNNLWGLGHQAELKGVQSFKATSGNFNYTVPELAGHDVDLFVNASGLRRQEISFTRLEYGGSIGLHKYFEALATDGSVRYNYLILNALDFTTFQEVASEGLTNPAVGSVTLDLKQDRRDNPLYPRRGYKVFTTLETGSSYLGGDANYQRIELLPSWYHSLGGGRYLALGVSHGVDVSFGSPANNLPFNSRFFPGGENSIRGYQEGQASPRNAFGQYLGAETYTLGTVQLEQALTPKWSVIFFSDSLGFAEHINHYPFDTGLFSVGLGLWWRTLIGPVRLEYGYNLNPRPGDPSGTVQFSFGFPF